MNRRERDSFIGQLYREGWTQADLANRFHLSVPRIGQILARLGLEKMDRPKAQSTPGKYTVVRLPGPIKDALLHYASTEKVSMSTIVARAVEADLRARGVSIQDPILNTLDLPQLPFEDPA